MFLVSVQDFDSGSTTRAVGPDMVLSAGDLLYFSGKFDDFGRVCEEHGLEAITNENDENEENTAGTWTAGPAGGELLERVIEEDCSVDSSSEKMNGEKLPRLGETISLATYGSTKEEFMTSSRDTRLLAIYKLREMMDKHSSSVGVAGAEGGGSPTGKRSRSGSAGNGGEATGVGGDRTPSGVRTPRQNSFDLASGSAPAGMTLLNSLAPATVVVAPDPTTSKKNVILIGINAPDRPGLLHDISKGLNRLSLQALRTEANVVGLRSVSIWRCEVGGALRRERRLRYGVDEGDVEEIWSVLNALLETEGGSEAIKQKGLRVVRTRVPGDSTLIGKTAKEAKFRVCFRAAIVAVKRGGGELRAG